MEEEKKKKERTIMPIIWGVMILLIVVVLIISNSKKNKQNNVAVESDNVVQIETKKSEKEEESETKTEVILNKNSVILSVGGSETLEITGNSKKKLSWSSSHPSIASVDDSGRVTAVSMGTAIITGQTEDGSKGNCTIIVKGGAVASKEESSSSSSNTNKVTKPTQNSNNNNNNNNYKPSQPGNSDNYNDPTEPNEPVNPDEPIEVIKCTVRFVFDGNETIKEVEEGQPIGELPNVPSKYGYTFRGWFIGTTSVTPDTIVTENMELVARWDTYTFELALINGDEVSPNRIVKVYKNGQSINVKELFGTLGDTDEYTLATWNEELGAVRCVSAKQVENARDYMVILNNEAIPVYVANEK